MPCSQLKVASFESHITKAVTLTQQNCTTFVIRTRVKMEAPAFALDLIKENVLAWSNTVELTASVSIRQGPNYENELIIIIIMMTGVILIDIFVPFLRHCRHHHRHHH